MKQLPHDVDAEKATLGALLLDPPLGSKAAAMSVLIPESFYLPQHRIIYAAIMDLASEDTAIDDTTVVGRLSTQGRLDAAGGAAGVAWLTEAVSGPANLTHYARQVHDMHRRRMLVDVAVKAASSASDTSKGLTDICTSVTDQLAMLLQAGASGSMSMKAAVRMAMSELERRTKERDHTIGVPTGFMDIDRLVGTLEPGANYVLGARPSMGKTALAGNILLQCGAPALFISAEMSTQQIAQRFLCAESGVSPDRYRSGQLLDVEWPKLGRAAGVLADRKIWIEDRPGPSIADIRAMALQHQAQHGIQLLVIDYLQLCRGTDRRYAREQEIAQISRGSKAIAKEANVAVLVLSQLNRGVEARDDKRPRLSDLRESGAIEQDADVVMFLYREGYYRDDADQSAAELIVSKNRNGPTGTVKLHWNAKRTQFSSAAR
jgi:replicative DNA helicase